ncbi:MAG TPA: DNA polymerase III subunit [Thermoanaerobaculia bacterium]|nr:DNA polymerase III subunit [Thermoanaerobaculia bacterium]
MTTAAARVLETARRGELHHAVILYGAASEPLTELALGLAQTLNCPEGSIGDDCVVCTRIARRLHPDVHFAEIAGDRKLISIEQIREIVEGATMRPYEGRNKVFIIDPADALSVSGSNAMLKTLEEPPRDTHFILLTRSPDLLLPTIRSRSQQIHVGGEAPRDEALASFITDALARYAERRESTALLTLAAGVSQQDNPKDAIALFATVLCESVASGDSPLPNERLLAAADVAMAAIRWLGVNADARLLMEQAVAELAK